MKIEKIDTYILKVPLGDERFYSSQCAFPERNSFLVRVETDNGLVGWGEGGQYGPAEPVKACVKHVLGARVIGRDPMDAGVIWEEMYAGTRDFGQRGSYVEAISAIDIALWDVKAQALGVPVSTLLGGRHRESIAAYATGCYYRGQDVLDYEGALEALAAEARSYVDSGFLMLKIKVGLLDVEEDAERIRAIRKAIGPKVKLFVDCNHAYSATNAIRMGRVLEECGALFFEEPVVPEDLDGYRKVRQKLDIAIAGGEAVYTRYGFRDFIAGGCVDIVQPNLGVCGGFSEFQKVHALASSFGVRVVPHVWGSGVAIAATLQAISALPNEPHTANPIPSSNEPFIEFDRNPNPLRDQLLTNEFVLEDGRVKVPNGVGLGIEIDDCVLEEYSVEAKV